jgi:hypothetical protein
VAEQNTLRLDQPGCFAQQPAAFAHRLARQRDLALAQVAQAAVDQLRRARRRSPGEVARLDQHHGNAAPRRLEGDAGAGDAAADDEQVGRDVIAAAALAAHRRR